MSRLTCVAIILAVSLAMLLVVPDWSVHAAAASQVFLPIVYGSIPTPTATPVPPSSTATPGATITAVPATSTVAPPTPVPTPVNVIVNSGFEQGFTGWTPGGIPLLVPFAHSGSHAVYLGGYNNSRDGVGQLVVVPSCAQYAIIGYWAYPVAVPNNWGFVDDLTMTLIDFSNPELPTIATIYDYMALPPVNGPWHMRQLITGDLTPYRGHSVGTLIGSSTGPVSLSSWYVDDVQFSFNC